GEVVFGRCSALSACKKRTMAASLVRQRQPQRAASRRIRLPLRRTPLVIQRQVTLGSAPRRRAAWETLRDPPPAISRITSGESVTSCGCGGEGGEDAGCLDKAHSGKEGSATECREGFVVNARLRASCSRQILREDDWGPLVVSRNFLRKLL